MHNEFLILRLRELSKNDPYRETFEIFIKVACRYNFLIFVMDVMKWSIVIIKNEELVFKVSAVLIILPMIAVAISLFIPFDLFHYRIWADRDIIRGLSALAELPVTGAEYSDQGGRRTPGGGLYYLNFLLFEFFPSVVVVYNIHLALHVIGSFSLFIFLRKEIGYFGAAVSASLVLASPIIYFKILTEFWNPMQGWVFAICGFVLFCRYKFSGSAVAIFLGVFFLVLAAQAHITFISLLLASIFFIWRELNKKAVLIISLVIFIGYLPFIVSSQGVADGPSVSFLVKSLINNLSVGEPLEIATHIETIRLPFLALFIGALARYFFKTSPTVSGQIAIDALYATILSIALSSVAFSIKHQSSIGVEADRYFAQTVPLLAVLVGSACAFLVQVEYKKCRRWIVLGICILSVLIVDLRAASNIRSNIMRYITDGRYIDSDRWHISLSSTYAFQYKVFEDLHKNFNFTNSDILEKASMLAFFPRSEDVVMTTFLASDYILPKSQLDQRIKSGACVLIVSRATIDPRETIDIKATLNRIDETFEYDYGISGSRHLIAKERPRPVVHEVYYRNDYALAFFSYKSGYCPKSFNNRYLQTPIEKRVDSFFSTPRPEGVYRGTDNINFYVSADVPGSKTPLTMLHILHINGDEVAPELKGNSMRSYNGLGTPGYWQPNLIANPRWRFVDEKGLSLIAVCFEGVLGQRSHPGPCQAHPIKLKKGIYNVYFEADQIGYEDRFDDGRVISLAFPVHIKMDSTLEIRIE